MEELVCEEATPKASAQEKELLLWRGRRLGLRGFVGRDKRLVQALQGTE